MKNRSNKFDRLFSKLIRTRDQHTCQRCGATAETSKIDCSHFWGRRHQATRYDPLNACAHCFVCHRYLGENPIEFARWVRKYLGDVLYDELEQKHQRIVKRTKAEAEELYRHLKEQLKALERDPDHRVVAFD